MALVPYIASMRFYPLKAGGGVEIDEADLTERGLSKGSVHDRRLALINQQGAILTQDTEDLLRQRGYSVLATSKVSLVFGSDGEAEKVKISIGNQGALVVDPHIYTPEIIAFVYQGSAGTGHVVSHEADSYFSDALHQNVRLICQTHDDHRERISPTADLRIPLSYADDFPLHIVNRGTLNKVNRILSADDQMNIDQSRYNLLFANALPDEAYRWHKVKVSGIQLLIPQYCGRCSVITHNQTTGTFQNAAPSKRSLYMALHQLRTAEFGRESHNLTLPKFGVYAVPQTYGKMRKDSPLTVLQYK